MGKILISLGALVLTGMIAGSLVYATATSLGSVGVTVTAQSISVAVTDGAVSYGTVALSGSASTTAGDKDDSQNATNNGNQAETFNIKGQDTTGGTTWTLSGSIGSDQYMHKVCTNTCDGAATWRTMSTSYITLDTNIAQVATSTFDLQILMPSGSTDAVQKAADVTVQAIAYP